MTLTKSGYGARMSPKTRRRCLRSMPAAVFCRFRASFCVVSTGRVSLNPKRCIFGILPVIYVLSNLDFPPVNLRLVTSNGRKICLKRPIPHFWNTSRSCLPILLRISSGEGRRSSSTSGKTPVSLYSLTPIGLLISLSAYSATRSFLLLQSSKPILGLSNSVLS